MQRVAALRARTATQTSGRARATAKRRAPFGALQRLSSVTMHFASLRSSFLALRQNPLRHDGSSSRHHALYRSAATACAVALTISIADIVAATAIQIGKNNPLIGKS